MTMPDDLKLESIGVRGFLVLVWRVMVLIAILGIAFSAGQDRAEIKGRIMSLEKWQDGIMVLAESRDVRIRSNERMIDVLKEKVDSIQNAATRIESRLELLRQDVRSIDDGKRDAK